MDFLYLLKEIRTPFLTTLFSAITPLGDEIGFLVLAVIVYWCVSCVMGYYIMFVGYFGLLGNQTLKLLCRVPRPWVMDPNFTTAVKDVEGDLINGRGYSFPSGHAQDAVASFGAVARFTRRAWVRLLCIAVAVLVIFSRMYLGVHTPLDVGVGAATSLVLMLALFPLFRSVTEKQRRIPVLMSILLLMSVGCLIFLTSYTFPAEMDAKQLADGVKNSYTLLGAAASAFLSGLIWYRRGSFETSAKWYAQILKVVLGLGLLLAIRTGLKAPLNALLGEHVGQAVRYFFVTGFALTLWPMTFRWFSKLGRKGSV